MLPAFRKHFIRITSLDSQATVSSFSEEDSEAGTHTVTITQEKHRPPGPDTRSVPSPGLRGCRRRRGSLSYRTLDTEEEQLRVRSTHQQLFTEELAGPVPGAGSGPGAHDEQGRKTLPTGRLHQPSHTRAGGAGQQPHERGGWAVTHTSGGAGQQSHTRAGRRRQGARGRRVHSDRSGGSRTLLGQHCQAV